MFSVFKNSVDDSNTSVNPAHVIALAITAAAIFWVSWIVIHTRTMPDLNGIAYLLGGSGAVNLAHKAEEIVNSIKKAV
jgi:hypothetical protein